MPKRYAQPHGGEVEVTVGDETYKGSWTVERGTITVSWGAQVKTTQVGGSAGRGEAGLAKIMLRELVEGR